jgi:cell division GTPase FtsZ
MIEPVLSSKANKTRYILTVGIGKSSFSAIDCIYREGLDYVDYLLIDPAITDKHEKIQTIDRELDNCKFLILVCSLEDVVDCDLMNSIVDITTQTLVQTFLLLIIPEKLTDAEESIKIISELTQLSKNINLVIPIRADSQKTIVGKNPDSDRFWNSDYHTMWFVKTINSIAFVPGYISTDYADVYDSIKKKGFGFYAMGKCLANSLDHRCMEAFNNLVLTSENVLDKIAYAKYLLLFIDSGPKDLHADEIMELIHYLYQDLNSKAVFVWNCSFYELQDRVRVTIIGTGFSEISSLI